MRSNFLTAVLFVLSMACVSSGQNSPLSLRDIEQRLRGGENRSHLAIEVWKAGVDFSLTRVFEDRLREAGADSRLLAIIRESAAAEDAVVPAPAPDITPPKPVRTPDPGYAEPASLVHREGKAVLTFVIGKDGKPKHIESVRKVGFGLDEEARKAVQRWEFIPASRGGLAVPVRMTAEINFQLDHPTETRDSNSTPPPTGSSTGELAAWHLQRGQELEAALKPVNAASEFRMAIDIDPSNPDPYFELGRVLLWTCHVDETTGAPAVPPEAIEALQSYLFLYSAGPASKNAEYLLAYLGVPNESERVTANLASVRRNSAKEAVTSAGGSASSNCPPGMSRVPTAYGSYCAGSSDQTHETQHSVAQSESTGPTSQTTGHMSRDSESSSCPAGMSRVPTAYGSYCAGTNEERNATQQSSAQGGSSATQVAGSTPKDAETASCPEGMSRTQTAYGSYCSGPNEKTSNAYSARGTASETQNAEGAYNNPSATTNSAPSGQGVFLGPTAPASSDASGQGVFLGPAAPANSNSSGQGVFLGSTAPANSNSSGQANGSVGDVQAGDRGFGTCPRWSPSFDLITNQEVLASLKSTDWDLAAQQNGGPEAAIHALSATLQDAKGKLFAAEVAIERTAADCTGVNSPISWSECANPGDALEAARCERLNLREMILATQGAIDLATCRSNPSGYRPSPVTVGPNTPGFRTLSCNPRPRVTEPPLIATPSVQEPPPSRQTESTPCASHCVAK